MKLSLIMIAKDSLDQLRELKPHIRPYIDEWVLVVPPKDPALPWAEGNVDKLIVEDFTQEIEPEIREKMKDYGLEVDEDYKLFRFADARNASKNAASGDYMIWLDADDIPIGMDNIKKFIEKYPTTEAFNAVYDYYRDEEGNSISDHVRERIVRNNGKFGWKGGELGLIHETLIPEEGYKPLYYTIPEDIFRVEHHSDHVDASSMRNHIALLYEYLKTDGEDARTTYYLGVEYFNRGMFDYCIKILLEYVKVSGWDEERYHAWLKIAEAYSMLNDLESARNAYLSAINEMPSYPHAYLGMGESYFKEENWGKAIEFTLTGLQKKMPKTMYVNDKIRMTFRPAIFVALSYQQLGKQDAAYEWFIKAAKINPKHPWVQEYKGMFAESKDLDDYVKSFVKIGQITQRLYPKMLPKLAEAIPDDLMEQELLMDFKWRYMKPKIWDDKSVVFFCSHAFEDWGPESLEKGCGGSEESVIQISKRLIKLGWDVTVYNNCIKEQIVDGVKWVRYERFNPRDMFNILISWRNNMFLDTMTCQKKYIDMHDVPTKPIEVNYPVDETSDVKILVKSNYHRSLFTHLPDENFVVIPNGIDLEQFEGKKEKVENNLVWTSSYDRGLENLLEMWPDIKEEVPDATLDVYYGFELYNSTPWGKTKKGQQWVVYMQKLLQQDGITDHGRVGSDEVAEAMRRADVWAYPTRFPEISCITALKAQAAGCIPICTDYAALPETVKKGIKISGNINTDETKASFKAQLIGLLKDPEMKAYIRKDLNVAKYSWGKIAHKWSKEFKS